MRVATWSRSPQALKADAFAELLLLWSPIMRPKNEKPVCDFVRSILIAATGTLVEITDYPERAGRPTKEVEQLWGSATHSFAIEHTLLESFVGQLTDDAKFVKLIEPLESQLTGRL